MNPTTPKMKSAPAPGRNPWPIAIIVFFALAVTGLASFVVFAARHPMELVSPRYYEDEIRYQQQIDRSNRTRSIARQVGIDFDSARRVIRIRLPAEHAKTISAGAICFYRPSSANLDFELPLALDRGGIQEIAADNFRSGLWKVRVNWNATGEQYSFDQPVVIQEKNNIR